MMVESVAASYRVQLGDRGRLVLPAEVRKRMKLAKGDNLVLTFESDRALRLTSTRQVVRETKGIYAARAPHRVLSDELVADRRKEVGRETRKR